MARNPRLLLVLVLLVTGSSCTATRTREFTREVYEPAGEVLAASRVLEAGLGRVRENLGESGGARNMAQLVLSLIEK